MKKIDESMERADISHTRRLFQFIILMWSLFVIIVLLWNWHNNAEHYKTIALYQSQIAFQKDIIYRHWVASHGGVYVPVTIATPSNPNLSHIKNRDVITSSGKNSHL